jgi:hypothetical protein
MPTIDELMTGKQPGEIKVRLSYWPETTWFRPMFKDKSGENWFGQKTNGDAEQWFGNDDWQLWQEPVEEVEVFEWMYKVKPHDRWLLDAGLMTETEVKKRFGGEDRFRYRKTGRSWRVPK